MGQSAGYVEAHQEQERWRLRSACSGGFYRARPDDDDKGGDADDGTETISERSGFVERTRTVMVSPTSGRRLSCGASSVSTYRWRLNSNEYATAATGRVRELRISTASTRAGTDPRSSSHPASTTAERKSQRSEPGTAR